MRASPARRARRVRALSRYETSRPCFDRSSRPRRTRRASAARAASDVNPKRPRSSTRPPDQATVAAGRCSSSLPRIVTTRSWGWTPVDSTTLAGMTTVTAFIQHLRRQPTQEVLIINGGGSAAARRPRSLQVSLDVEVEPDTGAHDPATARQGEVGGHVVVPAIELALRRERELGAGAAGERHRALEGRVERDGAADAP